MDGRVPKAVYREPKALRNLLTEAQQKIVQVKAPSKTSPSHVTSSLAQICVSELYKSHQSVTLPLRPHLSHPVPNMLSVTQPMQDKYHPLALVPKQPTVRRPKRMLPVVSDRKQYRGVVFRVGDHRDAALRTAVLAADTAADASVQCEMPSARLEIPGEHPAAAPAAVPHQVRRHVSAAQRPKAPEVAPACSYIPLRKQGRQSGRSSSRHRQPSIHPYNQAAHRSREIHSSAQAREATIAGLLQPTTISKGRGGLTALPCLAPRSANRSQSSHHAPFSDVETGSLPSRGWDSDSTDSLQGGRRVVSERPRAKCATFSKDVLSRNTSDRESPPAFKRLGAMPSLAIPSTLSLLGDDSSNGGYYMPPERPNAIKAVFKPLADTCSQMHGDASTDGKAAVSAVPANNCMAGSAPVNAKSGSGEVALSQRRHRQLPHAVAQSNLMASGMRRGFGHTPESQHNVSVHVKSGRKVLASGFQVKSYTGTSRLTRIPRLANTDDQGFPSGVVVTRR